MNMNTIYDFNGTEDFKLTLKLHREIAKIYILTDNNLF